MPNTNRVGILQVVEGKAGKRLGWEPDPGKAAHAQTERAFANSTFSVARCMRQRGVVCNR
jgi:hypothetical protein